MAIEYKDFFLEGTKLSMIITEYDWEYAAMHWHDYWEILVGLEGKTEVKIGNKDYLLAENEMIIIGPNQLHETKLLSESHRILLLQFKTSVLDPIIDLDNEKKYIPLIVGACQFTNQIQKKDSEELSGVVKKIQRADKEKNPGYEFYVYAQMMFLMSSLIKNQYIKIEEMDPGRRKALHTLRPAIDYIRENYNQKIDQEKLAELCFLSTTHFSRIFKNAMGMSMVEYITELRMKEAGRMLFLKEKSVTQIAMELGFSTVNYFNKVFRKYYQMSPREYLRKIV